MPSYYRILLGRKNAHAAECFAAGVIGADFDVAEDLTGRLPDEWRDFNAEFIPLYLARYPEKTRIGAGLVCGMVWTICRGVKTGDVVLCPDGSGTYRVGEVVSEYFFERGTALPHRRRVRWLEKGIARERMSEALRGSTGSIGSVSNVTKHADEIRSFLDECPPPPPPCVTPETEDPLAFAMEKHLEDFLVENWDQTDLGRDFEIWREDGELRGQQYMTDTGPLDILAVSRDRKRLLVVELKRGRASDVVVGQVLRYMGYVKEELASEGQTVEGAVVALEDDQRLRRALSVCPSVRFYRYQISFRLVPG